MERKMAFIFGRGKKISRWLRAKPRLFFDWEKREGVLPPELCDEHKHEEGTPMLLEQATPTNVSRAIREINAFEWEGDFKPMARQALKQLVEKRLEEEMAEYLGVSRYEHGADRVDYRNGYYVRHLLTEMGDLELLVPRSRGRISHPAHRTLCAPVSLGGSGIAGLFLFGAVHSQSRFCAGSRAGRKGLGLNDLSDFTGARYRG